MAERNRAEINQNISIKASSTTLDIYDFSTGELLAVIANDSYIMFNKGATLHKGTMMIIYNLMLDFKGELEMRKQGYQLW